MDKQHGEVKPNLSVDKDQVVFEPFRCGNGYRLGDEVPFFFRVSGLKMIYVGLKMGRKITYFGLKMAKGFNRWTAYPYQNV